GGREHAGLNCVPSFWRALIAAASAVSAPMPALRRILLGGESIKADLLEATRSHLPHAEIWNLYGPTEATANVAAERLRDGEPVTIGRPIPGARLYVLDALLRPVPAGVPGELCIGGLPVARGYLGRADLTAGRFVPDPFGARQGGRLYRTGDRVRHLPDGRIEYLGRLDRQVKIRGLRIELEEVESVLRRHESVRDVVVLDRPAPA